MTAEILTLLLFFFSYYLYLHILKCRIYITTRLLFSFTCFGDGWNEKERMGWTAASLSLRSHVHFPPFSIIQLSADESVVEWKGKGSRQVRRKRSQVQFTWEDGTCPFFLVFSCFFSSHVGHFSWIGEMRTYCLEY